MSAVYGRHMAKMRNETTMHHKISLFGNGLERSFADILNYKRGNLRVVFKKVFFKEFQQRYGAPMAYE